MRCFDCFLEENTAQNSRIQSHALTFDIGFNSNWSWDTGIRSTLCLKWPQMAIYISEKLGNKCEYTTNTTQLYQEARAAAAFVTLFKLQLNIATASEEIGMTAVCVWRIVLAHGRHGLCEVDEKTGTPQRK